MEKNILDSLSRGEVIPGIPIHKTKAEGPPKELLPKSHVRTISAMHGVLLEELGVNPNTTLKESGNETPKYQKATQRNSASMSGRPPLPEFRRSVQDVEKTSTQRNSVSSEKLSRQKMGEKITDETNQKPVCDLAGEKILDAPINDKLYELRHDQIDVSTRPLMGHTRRNTGGTIYLQNSMANPDVKATIKCVCGVYRAHIGQSKKHAHACRNNNAKSISKFGVFDDNFGSRKRRGSTQVPSLTEIVEFYEAFYERSQMEHDTIIFSLIYIERLIKSTNGTLAPSPGNWRSFLFSCMVLASKVWDDLSMWNNDFANVTAHTVGLTLFTLPRINELELALLKCLEFDVKVSASEYAKYYFLIRTMLLRSGLVKEDEKPLGKRKAFEKLEALTNPNLDRYPASESRDRRSKSMDGGIFDTISNKDLLSGDPVLNDSVCLEQLVN
ncbi:unnamed protein product [Pseudo-nitzschia multistriata]|uniref:Cyclin N-terminal domain-containing protein n=1 Tax=Pseudo-nitzschia multistriata TaxID=183589 RepID=A0A448ZAF9_9STRA|nr:unnamed protein product [Pseudo-nitzschia multistriata]